MIRNTIAGGVLLGIGALGINVAYYAGKHIAPWAEKALPIAVAIILSWIIGGLLRDSKNLAEIREEAKKYINSKSKY